jgi:hypothetical protein
MRKNILFNYSAFAGIFAVALVVCAGSGRRASAQATRDKNTVQISITNEVNGPQPNASDRNVAPTTASMQVNGPDGSPFLSNNVEPQRCIPPNSVKLDGVANDGITPIRCSNCSFKCRPALGGNYVAGGGPANTGTQCGVNNVAVCASNSGTIEVNGAFIPSHSSVKRDTASGFVLSVPEAGTW